MTNTTCEIIADLPKYALETVAFCGILFIILYLIWIKGDFQKIIPLVGVYAFAVYRLMPSLQLVFRGSVKIKSNISVIELIHSHIFDKPEDARLAAPCEGRLPFAASITIRDMTFTYPQAPEPAVRKIHLTIGCNTSVGFVGPTGCGKTTLVDLILGLLIQQEGELCVDGVPLTFRNLRCWQNNLGYVPQSIYLIDDTIVKNIAFGIPEKAVDLKAVERAAQTANIHDFIVNDLPQGYDSEVGERGIRISGGQRQRIGIAGALYHDPSVLVLDEATSALDGVTENVIMEAIQKLAHKKTLIMIAHRLTTVKECDTIHIIDKRRIVDSGTYDELVERNDYFRQMAKV